MDFLDATGTLVIDDPADFHALINGFTGSTIIDLIDTLPTAITDAQYAGDQLTLTTDTGTDVLRVAGVGSIANFSFDLDAAGTGTAISWHA